MRANARFFFEFIREEITLVFYPSLHMSSFLFGPCVENSIREPMGSYTGNLNEKSSDLPIRQGTGRTGDRE